MALSAACGGDGTGPREPIPEALVGTWQASPACQPECRFTFTNMADAQEEVNFTTLGATSRLTLNESGSFVFSAGVPSTTPIAGRIHVEGSDLVVEASGEFPEERIGYSLQAGRLHLEWDETFAFDLDEDGVAEDVRVRAVLEQLPQLLLTAPPSPAPATQDRDPASVARGTLGQIGRLLRSGPQHATVTVVIVHRSPSETATECSLWRTAWRAFA